MCIYLCVWFCICHPSSHPFVHPSIQPSIHPSVQPFIHPSPVHLSIHSCVHRSVRSTISHLCILPVGCQLGACSRDAALQVGPCWQTMLHSNDKEKYGGVSGRRYLLKALKEGSFQLAAALREPCFPSLHTPLVCFPCTPKTFLLMIGCLLV